MNVIETIENFGIIGTMIIASVAIATLVFKNVVSAAFNKKLENLKHEQYKQLETYKAELNKQFEGFRSTLNKNLVEHQITFSTLHQNKATVIRELYKMIVKVEVETEEGDDDKKWKEIITAVKEVSILN